MDNRLFFEHQLLAIGEEEFPVDVEVQLGRLKFLGFGSCLVELLVGELGSQSEQFPHFLAISEVDLNTFSHYTPWIILYALVEWTIKFIHCRWSIKTIINGFDYSFGLHGCS